MTVLCYPPHPAVDRLTELVLTSYQLDGTDPPSDAAWPHLFREVGLTEAGAEAHAEVYRAGHPSARWISTWSG